MVNPKQIKIVSPITGELITVTACMAGMYYVIDAVVYSFTKEDLKAQ
jgi:hypothetical protein